jgi:hypothetical protein
LPTQHNKIKYLKERSFDISEYLKQAEKMQEILEEPEDNRGKIRQLLKKMVPCATISEQKTY